MLLLSFSSSPDNQNFSTVYDQIQRLKDLIKDSEDRSRLSKSRVRLPVTSKLQPSSLIHWHNKHFTNEPAVVKAKLDQRHDKNIRLAKQQLTAGLVILSPTLKFSNLLFSFENKTDKKIFFFFNFGQTDKIFDSFGRFRLLRRSRRCLKARNQNKPEYFYFGFQGDGRRHGDLLPLIFVVWNALEVFPNEESYKGILL